MRINPYQNYVLDLNDDPGPTIKEKVGDVVSWIFLVLGILMYPLSFLATKTVCENTTMRQAGQSYLFFFLTMFALDIVKNIGILIWISGIID